MRTTIVYASHMNHGSNPQWDIRPSEYAETYDTVEVGPPEGYLFEWDDCNDQNDPWIVDKWDRYERYALSGCLIDYADRPIVEIPHEEYNPSEGYWEDGWYVLDLPIVSEISPISE